MAVDPALAEIFEHLLRSPWRGRRGRRIECRRMPVFGFSTREILAFLFRTQSIARRVARAAMPEAVDEIGATIPLRALRRIGTVPAAVQRAHLPRGQQRAD